MPDILKDWKEVKRENGRFDLVYSLEYSDALKKYKATITTGKDSCSLVFNAIAPPNEKGCVTNIKDQESLRDAYIEILASNTGINLIEM